MAAHMLKSWFEGRNFPVARFPLCGYVNSKWRANGSSLRKQARMLRATSRAFVTTRVYTGYEI